MSDDDNKPELERLRSENAALKKGASEGTLCVPKTESERIDDGVRPEWRANS